MMKIVHNNDTMAGEPRQVEAIESVQNSTMQPSNQLEPLSLLTTSVIPLLYPFLGLLWQVARTRSPVSNQDHS